MTQDRASLSVLCIDDDAVFLKLVGRRLARDGWRVDTAATLSEAVEKLDADTYDVVTLDHHLPQGAGLELLRRRHHEAPPFIYLTGSQEARIAIEALRAGAADYIIKETDDEFFDLLDKTLRKAVEAARTAREKREAEKKLRQALDRAETLLAQKTVLLRELDHRVGNSLQMVSSILSLQARKADPVVAAALRDANERIRAIAGAHRYISYEGPTGSVDLAQYLNQLLEGVWASISMPELRKLSTDLSSVTVPAHQAVSVGIIAIELVMNACKHAYDADESGTVTVRLSPASDGYVLSVEDAGRGIPDDVKTTRPGIGAMLVESLVRTHSGRLDHETDAEGHKAILRVPLAKAA